jgi:hypothetical protein
MDSLFADDTATWIDPAGRDLSQRIWGNKAGLRAHVERMIADAIARGLTVEDVTSHLIQYVSPDYARAGEGKARYAAQRLATHELRRASSIAARDTAITNPTGGYLRYTLGAGHSEADECTNHASHDEGLGRGVWLARDCPLPPRHIGCGCSVTEVGVDARGMNAFVDSLRVEYGLEDPPDLSPDELAVFRQGTAQIREDVRIMFRAWFEQTGLVSRESLMESSPTVREWVESVKKAKVTR